MLDQLVAEIVAVEDVDMRQFPYFPLDIERHPFHMLQIMQATDVSYDHAFVTPKGRFTRRNLVDGGTALLVPDEIHDELSWTVSVLCNEFPLGQGSASRPFVARRSSFRTSCVATSSRLRPRMRTSSRS